MSALYQFQNDYSCVYRSRPPSNHQQQQQVGELLTSSMPTDDIAAVNYFPSGDHVVTAAPEMNSSLPPTTADCNRKCHVQISTSGLNRLPTAVVAPMMRPPPTGNSRGWCDVTSAVNLPPFETFTRRECKLHGCNETTLGVVGVGETLRNNPK